MLGSLAPLRCQNVSICSHSINLTSSAAISRQFSIFSRFSRKKKKQKTAEELEAYDINRLEEIIPISMALSNLTVKNLHPLHEVSRAIKESLTSSDPSFGDDAEVKTFIKTNYVHLLGKNVAKELERFDGLHLYRQHCILDNLNDPNTNTDMDIRSKTKDVSSEVMETSSSSSAGAVTAPEEPRIHNQTDSEYYLEHRENFETMIRLRLLHNYIRRIQRAVHDDEIQVSILDTHAKCCSLVDAFLRGTPSERIAEHIELYGPTLTPWLTQACFYAYCEPELETLVDFWYGDLERAAVLPTRKRRFLPFLTTSVTPKIKPSAIQKENLRLFLEHKKHLLPFSKAYLLDTLELNTKARCCFAWTGECSPCL